MLLQAIYPLALMVVIYLCIEMYDRGVRVVVLCVEAIPHVFHLFQKEVESQGFCDQYFCCFPAAFVLKAAGSIILQLIRC